MQYDIQLDESLGVIHVCAMGEWDAEVDNMLVRSIMQTVAQSGLRKVLLDMRELSFDLSMLQIFERAKELRKLRMKRRQTSSRVALLYTSGNPKLDQDMKFFETAAQNQGAPYRVFCDLNQALEWLTVAELVR